MGFEGASIAVKCGVEFFEREVSSFEGLHVVLATSHFVTDLFILRVARTLFRFVPWCIFMYGTQQLSLLGSTVICAVCGIVSFFSDHRCFSVISVNS